MGFLAKLTLACAAIANAEIKMTPACAATSCAGGFGVVFLGAFAANEAHHANHPTTVLPPADEMQSVMMSLEFKNGSRYLSTKQLDEMVASGVVETAIASVLEEQYQVSAAVELAESRKAIPTSRKLKSQKKISEEQSYSTSVQCASNYGTDEICCNQPGTPSTTANQCPVQYPACSDYVFNNHWGTCVSSASAGCYSSAVAGTINCAQLPCFNQNTGYSSLQDAESACNANSDCMYIMQFTDGDWYLRSADDLSTQGGAFLAGDGNFILTRTCPAAATPMPSVLKFNVACKSTFWYAGTSGTSGTCYTALAHFYCRCTSSQGCPEFSGRVGKLLSGPVLSTNMIEAEPITAIADQTNLLALNAAIEATRAGQDWCSNWSPNLKLELALNPPLTGCQTCGIDCDGCNPFGPGYA